MRLMTARAAAAAESSQTDGLNSRRQPLRVRTGAWTTVASAGEEC